MRESRRTPSSRPSRRKTESHTNAGVERSSKPRGSRSSRLATPESSSRFASPKRSSRSAVPERSSRRQSSSFDNAARTTLSKSRQNTSFQRKPSRSSHSTAREIGENQFSQAVWTKSTSRQRQGGAQGASSNNRRSSASKNIPAFGFMQNRTVQICVIVLALVVVLFGTDHILNSGKIYSGVKVGGVDIGGKTQEEAAFILQDSFGNVSSEKTAVFYADEAAKNDSALHATHASLAEQISYEESLNNRRQWTIGPETLDARFDASAMASQAYEVGRSEGGIFARLQCMLGGYNLDPTCTFNEELLEEMRQSISASVGTLRVNYGVEIQDAVAVVTEGHDGNEMTKEWFVKALNDAYLYDNDLSEYIVILEYMPLQVNQADAEEVATAINNSIAYGATFVFGDSSWTVEKEELATWISAEVVEEGAVATLKPLFKEKSAKSSLLAGTRENIANSELSVTFEKDAEGNVTVSSNATGQVPQVAETIAYMNDTFFSTEQRTETPQIEVSAVDIPSTMSFQDALDYGVVGEIQSYTTQYAEGVEARNHNIHLASDYLTNSIVKANGGTWSFNDIAGEATTERGYQGAGAIVSGEYTDAVGGGICQVATTIFNSVYEAGYPVEERRNHTLYIASYPEGRDAAIAYPDFDLVWRNDSNSDVLLVMSYTNSSVTATLYGVDPGYVVSSEVGEWKEGKKHKTTYRKDETLKQGEEVVETAGSDGREITVVRTVRDKAGNLLHEQSFNSVYQPIDEVIVQGTAQANADEAS